MDFQELGGAMRENRSEREAFVGDACTSDFGMCDYRAVCQFHRMAFPTEVRSQVCTPLHGIDREEVMSGISRAMDVAELEPAF